jgi:hypothetical protein
MPKETRICKRARRIALAFHTLCNRDDNESSVCGEIITFCGKVAEGAIPEKHWPGRMLSWDAKVTLLAALHDACLPDSTPLLEPIRTFGATHANHDEIKRAMCLVDSWCFPALHGNSKKLDALQT